MDRVLEPGAQIAAVFGGAPVQRPDLLASDRRDAPAPADRDVAQQIGQQLRIGGHAGFDAHHEIIFRRPVVAVIARDCGGGANHAEVETFELGLDPLGAHQFQKLADLVDRIVEQDRRPSPAPVGARLQVVERTRVERGDLGPRRRQAFQRAGDVVAYHPGRLVNNDPGAGVADRHDDRGRDLRLPGRPMPEVRLLPPEMDMDDARPLVKGAGSSSPAISWVKAPRRSRPSSVTPLSRRSRNQKGVRRLSNNQPRLSRAVLDDPPIHIRPNCSRQSGCKGKNPLDSSHDGPTILPKNISDRNANLRQKYHEFSP